MTFRRPFWVLLVTTLAAPRPAAGQARPPARPAAADPRVEEAKRLGAEVDKLYAAGEYARALKPAERSAALFEAALGPQAPDLAVALQDLAELNRSLGAFDRAAACAQRALAIRERLGDPLGIANALSFLAPVYYSMGSYERAEMLFRRALALYEAQKGPEATETATALNNLAAVYKQVGDYAHAEPLYQRALALREKRGAPADLAISVNNLAELYVAQGAYERATPLLERSLALREKAFGPTHPLVATALVNLGSSYKDMTDFARAEPLLRRALEIDEKTYGPVHPQVAYSANALATLYVALHRPDRAEPLLRRALAITEQLLPKTHGDIAHALGNLSGFLAGRGHTAEALALLRRELDITEHMLRGARLVATESRMAAFLRTLRAQEQAVYSLLAEHPGDAEARRLALAVALLRKGRSIDEAADTSRAVLMGLGAADREVFEQLRQLRGRIASLELAGLGKLSRGDRQAKLEALEAEAERLEQDLAQRSAPLRALRQQPLPDQVIERVARALPADGALVEVVAYRPFHFREGLPARRWGPLRYLALTLSPAGAIGMAELGPAAAVDGAVARLLTALRRPDSEPVAAARALERLVVEPLRPLLGESRRLLLSLDGALQLVPFAALHDGRGYLVDRYDFGYLPSGRDLLGAPAMAAAGPVARGGAVLVVDPAFDAAPGAPEPAGGGALLASAARAGTSQRERGLLPGTIPPLPGTRAEAEAIRKLLPGARILGGREATEPALLGLRAPDILHVATHGVFLADATAPPAGSAGSRSLKLVPEPGATPASGNPLVRSALLLAGAGAAAGTGADAPVTDAPDGVATALEVAGMNLWGTELVVLSACDTGRGEIRLGQGVYGLRRAVLMAGAEPLVTSLWRIDDEVTRELMTRFYEGLLSGRGRLDAMNAAARAVRRVHPHPYYWAPFLVIGRTDPLRGPGAVPAAAPAR